MNNRLTNFTDRAQHVGSSGFTNDLQTYPAAGTNSSSFNALATSRFSYDPTGNLTKDESNALTSIRWNHWGKATEIVKDDGSKLRFVYDPLGNRWSKTVVRKSGATVYDSLYLREYTIRDAGGNELALYRHRQQYSEQQVAQEVLNPSSTGATLSMSDMGGVVVGDGGFGSVLAGSSAVLAPAFTQSRLSAGSGFGVDAYFEGDGAVRRHLIAEGGPGLLGSVLGGGQGGALQARLVGSVQYEPVLFAPLLKVVAAGDSAGAAKLATVLMGSSAFKTRFGTGSSAYNNGVGMSDAALGARLAGELQDEAKYRGIGEAEAMLKSYLNVSSAGRVADTVLYAQLAGRLLTDTAYSVAPVRGGNSATLRSLYTQRLSQLTTQAGIEGATHPDHSLYSYIKTAAVAGYTASKGGNTASGALSALRTRFEDGQLLSVQYSADPVGYLSAVQSSGAGGAALLQSAMAGVTGTTAPSVAMKTGITSSASLSQMGLSGDVFYLSSHTLYGSSRLGIKEYYPSQYRYEWNMAKTVAQNKATLDSSTTAYRMPWYSHLYNSMIAFDKTTPFTGNVGNGNPYPFWSSHIIGQKKYELSNHLGNVMAVVSDKVTEQGTTKRAALRAAYDYYPFGMLMPMRSVEDESIHCVPVSRTRYENLKVPIAAATTGGIFGTATLVPVPGGGGVIFQNDPGTVSIGATAAPVKMGTEFALPALTGTAVGVHFSFRAAVEGSFVESSLQWYNAAGSEWKELSALSQGSGTFDFNLPAGVPVGAPLKVVVQTTDASQALYLSDMSYRTITDGLSAMPDVGNGTGSAFAQSQNLNLAPPEAGVVFSNSASSLDVQVQGSGPVPLGVELPLPALGTGGRGVQLSVVGGSSGESPLRGSLQQYNPSNGNWQEIRGVMSGSGGALSVDVAGGIPAGVPLKFVVTMDAGSYLHLGQMSYGEYATGEVPNAGVNSSAFASATNLNLAPLPEGVSVDVGADYVHLHAGNGVEVPMGLEMTLPAVSNGATGASLSFNVDNGGGEATASLQAQVNGTWQELSSSLVVAGGTAQLEVLDWALPAGTPLKVVAFTNAGVDMGVSELVYYTVTKAVQTYMALSCDTDSHWSDPTRGFNGQARMDELAGKGNHYTATFWEYDPRTGKRWNLDPVDQVSISNYGVNKLNPIMWSDPKGDDPSTHTDKNGYVVQVKNDGDMGVYKHDNLSSWDGKKSLPNINGWGVTKMGETWTPLGFADFGKYEASGEVVPGPGARIDFNSSWATLNVSAILNDNPSLGMYAIKARSGGEYDLKTHVPKGERPQYGSLLFGKFASARDAGNITAGMTAQRSIVPNKVSDYGFGKYNESKNSVPKMLWNMFGDVSDLLAPDGIGGTGQRGMESIRQSIYHGEDKLSKQGIEMGKTLLRKIGY